VASLISGGTALWIESHMAAPSLLTLGVKAGAFVLIYAVISLAAERGDYYRGVQWLWQIARSREVSP
jgi:hypothetical protein